MPSDGLNTGWIDGWSLIAPLPATVRTETDAGIRRGKFVQNALIKKNALSLKWDSVGAVNLAAKTYGIKKTVETETGKTYQFRVKVASAYTGPGGTVPSGVVKSFALRARGLEGSSVTLGSATGSATIPAFTFTATGSTTLLEVLITGAVNPGASALARVMFYDVALVQLDTELPQRFITTSFSSTLDKHFDLASNSVGGSWFVDKDGVTQFTPPAEMLPVSHVFTDQKKDETLEYTDISAGYDTRSIFNYLEIKNIGFDWPMPDKLAENIRKAAKGEGDSKPSATEDTYVWEDEDSQAEYGIRSASVTTNIALPSPRMMEQGPMSYPGFPTYPAPDWQNTPEGKAYFDLIDRLTKGKTEPRLLVSSLVFNAQQDMESAKKLEVGQRVIVVYRGVQQDLLIAGMSHDIRPDRWLITLTLARL